MTEETEEIEKKEYKVVEVTTETGLAVSSQEGKVISQLDLLVEIANNVSKIKKDISN